MLTLPIKKQWFDMIKCGIKREEYRGNTAYYDARFAKYADGPFWVVLRNGYSKNSDSIVCLVKAIKRKGGKAEWGGEADKLYWVLQIERTVDADNLFE